MIKVVKANVVLTVADDKLDYYVSKGYTAKTLEGKVIKEAIPSDFTSLKTAYVAQQQKIAALEAEIAKLKATTVKPDEPKPRKRAKAEE